MYLRYGMLLLLVVTGCVSHPGNRDELPSNLFPLGSVMVDAGRRELVITGFVNQVEGALELLACGPGGKTHESAFVLFADPHDMQAGLLLLGLRHGPPMPGVGLEPPKGDAVTITVHWYENGTARHALAEQFLTDVESNRPVKHGAWIFNGSVTENGRFKAVEEDSLIATYWDPWAIINLAGKIGGDDERISVNTKTIPPLHTSIRLVVRPVGKR